MEGKIKKIVTWGGIAAISVVIAIIPDPIPVVDEVVCGLTSLVSILGMIVQILKKK